MKKIFMFAVFFIIIMWGCSDNEENKREEGVKQEELYKVENSLEEALRKQIVVHMEDAGFEVQIDKLSYVFEQQYYAIAVAENVDYNLVCLNLYQDELQPIYLMIKDECLEKYLGQWELSSTMSFSDIIHFWGEADVFEMSYDDTTERRYKIEYVKGDLKYLFVAKNEDGKDFELFVALAQTDTVKKLPLMMPADKEIKSYLNMTVEELENLTKSKMETLSSIIVFETTIPFPVLIPQNESYWFVCRNRDVSYKPMYMAFYPEYEKEYLRQLGLKNCNSFQEIMEVMGGTDIKSSESREEFEKIGVTKYKNYKIEYDLNGLKYIFIANNYKGENYSFYIALSDDSTFENNVNEEKKEGNDKEIAMKLYEAFLCGETEVKGISHIDDITIPVGDSSQHYNTRYAYVDSNGDNIPDLHVDSGRYYYVISYKEGEIYVWNDFSVKSTNCKYIPTTNGGFFVRDYSSTYGKYSYSIFDNKGEVYYASTFNLIDVDENGYLDENDKYIIDNEEISKEEWEGMEREMFCRNKDGTIKVINEVEWNVLYK